MFASHKQCDRCSHTRPLPGASVRDRKCRMPGTQAPSVIPFPLKPTCTPRSFATRCAPAPPAPVFPNLENVAGASRRARHSRRNARRPLALRHLRRFRAWPQRRHQPPPRSLMRRRRQPALHRNPPPPRLPLYRGNRATDSCPSQLCTDKLAGSRNDSNRLRKSQRLKIVLRGSRNRRNLPPFW
jgi:hypothetical protein